MSRWPDAVLRLRAAEGKLRPFYGERTKNRHSYPLSISVILFNSRFVHMVHKEC